MRMNMFPETLLSVPDCDQCGKASQGELLKLALEGLFRCFIKLEEFDAV